MDKDQIIVLSSLHEGINSRLCLDSWSCWCRAGLESEASTVLPEAICLPMHGLFWYFSTCRCEGTRVLQAKHCPVLRHMQHQLENFSEDSSDSMLKSTMFAQILCA